MNLTSKLIAALLAVMVLFQVYTLKRQGELMQQIQNLGSSQNQLQSRLVSEVNNLHNRLSDMAEQERWMAVQNTNIEPADGCQTADASVQWELRQWTPGTTSRLLYRNGSDQPWQEATVQNLGGQNYKATFQVPATPMLESGVALSYAPNVSRERTSEMVTERVERAKDGFDQNFQYQILAEGPEFSRSGGVQGLPVYGQFVLPAKVHVRVERDNRYIVDFYTETERRNPCAQFDGAEVRAYNGEKLVSTMPLTQRMEGAPSFNVEWQSPEQLTRLAIYVRFGGQEDVIEVHL